MGGGDLALGKGKRRHVGGGQAEQGYITAVGPWEALGPSDAGFLLSSAC